MGATYRNNNLGFLSTPLLHWNNPLWPNMFDKLTLLQLFHQQDCRRPLHRIAVKMTNFRNELLTSKSDIDTRPGQKSASQEVHSGQGSSHSSVFVGNESEKYVKH